MPRPDKALPSSDFQTMDYYLDDMWMSEEQSVKYLQAQGFTLPQALEYLSLLVRQLNVSLAAQYPEVMGVGRSIPRARVGDF